MSLTVTLRKAGATGTASAGTFAFSPASNCTAGQLLVLVFTSENSAAGGTNPYSSIADSLGNTWTRRVYNHSTAGTANDGVCLNFFTTQQNAGTVTTGTTITVTYGTNTPGEGAVLWEVSSNTGSADYVNGNTTAGYWSIASIVTDTVAVGEVIFGALARTGGVTASGDSDTTNGTWSTQQTAVPGFNYANVTSQYKIQTTTPSTQTYDDGGSWGSNNRFVIGWIRVQETSSATTVESSLTANAVIQRAQSGSFSANAVPRREQSSSFIAEETTRRPQLGSFTAEMFVLGWFTADAWTGGLPTTIEDSRPADAVLRRSIDLTFTTAAVIQRTQPGSFSADAVHLKTQSLSFLIGSVGDPDGAQIASFVTTPGSFAADAIAHKEAGDSFAGDAVIWRNQAGSLTTDAFILGYFRADAIQRRTQTSSHAADAVVHQTGLGSFTASATILRVGPQLVTVYFADDFNRTVAMGLGGDWTWSNDDSNSTGPGSAWMSVDGSAAILPSYISANRYESYRGFPNIDEGIVQFDFWVPVIGGQAEVRPAYGVNFDRAAPVEMYVYPDSPGVWLIGTFWNGSSVNVPDAEFSPDPGTWYTAQMRFDVLQNVEYRVWKTGDQEPESPISSGRINDLTGPSSDGEAFLDFYYNAVYPYDAKADNFLLYVGEPGGSSYPRANAVLHASLAGSFTADAWIVYRIFGDFTASGFILGCLRADAVFGAARHDAFYANALVTDGSATAWESAFTADSSVVITGSRKYFTFVVDGWIIGTVAEFAANAQISSPSSSEITFTVDAEKSNTYRLRVFTADLITLTTEDGAFTAGSSIHDRNLFTANAVVGPWGSFAADAFVQPWFTANAYITGGFQFDADATVTKITIGVFVAGADLLGGDEIRGAFLVDAVALRAIASGLTADAEISVSTFTADSVFLVPSFTTDCYIQPYFTANAFIRDPFFSRTWFSANAYIYDPRWFTANAYLYKPNVYNPPPVEPPSGDPNPPPTPPPPAGPPVSEGRHVRILIGSGGTMTEITQDVVWNETEFTQQAKTAPGTFRCTLRGNFTQYDGGEDIYLEIDGYRQFGGLVTMVEYDYWYADKALAKTVLLGTDYNIYLDRIIVWNKPDNPAGSGMFVPFRGFRSELSDRSIIRYVCANLIDAPTGFDGITYVGLIDSNLMDGDKYFIKEGMTLREFMSEVSQVTNGLWWMDQFLSLHYVSRSDITAPASITDGPSGVSCRNLEWTSDTSSMANDAFVWGTLATTVAGKVVVSHNYDAEAIAKYGLRQYSEVRADLHDTDHIQKRASSIRFRRGIVIETASLDIFEAGFAAGQVVQLNITSYGRTKEFIIRAVRTKFLTMSSADGTTYYGLPIYHLDLGLDPEDPWNFYDMLPFDMTPWENFSGFVMPMWDFGVGDCGSATTDRFARIVAPGTTPTGWGVGPFGRYSESRDYVYGNQSTGAFLSNLYESVDGSVGKFGIYSGAKNTGPSWVTWGSGGAGPSVIFGGQYADPSADFACPPFSFSFDLHLSTDDVHRLSYWGMSALVVAQPDASIAYGREHYASTWEPDGIDLWETEHSNGVVINATDHTGTYNTPALHPTTITIEAVAENNIYDNYEELVLPIGDFLDIWWSFKVAIDFYGTRIWMWPKGTTRPVNPTAWAYANVPTEAIYISGGWEYDPHKYNVVGFLIGGAYSLTLPAYACNLVGYQGWRVAYQTPPDDGWVYENHDGGSNRGWNCNNGFAYIGTFHEEATEYWNDGDAIGYWISGHWGLTNNDIFPWIPQSPNGPLLVRDTSQTTYGYQSTTTDPSGNMQITSFTLNGTVGISARTWVQTIIGGHWVNSSVSVPWILCQYDDQYQPSESGEWHFAQGAIIASGTGTHGTSENVSVGIAMSESRRVQFAIFVVDPEAVLNNVSPTGELIDQPQVSVSLGGITFTNIVKTDASYPNYEGVGADLGIDNLSLCRGLSDPFDVLPWGWRTDIVIVGASGDFTSVVPAVTTSINAWIDGERLIPGVDWEIVTSSTFRLTADYLSSNSPDRVTITYLRQNPAAKSSWTRPSRKTITEINPDRERMLDVRGLD